MLSVTNGSALVLNFPNFYIVAPGSRKGGASSNTKALQVISLDKASPTAFNAWLCYIEATEKVIASFVSSIESPLDEKYRMINSLSEQGVDMTKYLFCSKASAHQALEAMQSPAISELPTISVRITTVWPPRLRLPLKLVAVSQEVQSA